MKRLSISYIVLLLWLLAACTEQETPARPEVPDGMVEVHVALPGMLTASAVAEGTQARTTANATARMTEEEFFERAEYTELLKDKHTLPLPEGTTLWLLVEGTPNGTESTAPDAAPPYSTLKAYVVKGSGLYQSLYPCTVNADGEVTSEEVAPLYLPFGTYTFRAVSPARAFLDEQGNPIEDPAKEIPDLFRQCISNGDYLISNDERYEQTRLASQTFEETDEKVQFVELNPLINQTAQLKFTIVLDKENPFLHSCDIAPAGVEISGLQNRYGREDAGKELWNWSPELPDTLIAYPGRKNEQLVIPDNHAGVTKTDDGLVIETAVLPTDATSNSIIVLFNLIVNDIPTQYEMMLNRKILRAAFSYHYKGTLTITEGISAIVWQNVSWSTDIELDI